MFDDLAVHGIGSRTASYRRLGGRPGQLLLWRRWVWASLSGRKSSLGIGYALGTRAHEAASRLCITAYGCRRGESKSLLEYGINRAIDTETAVLQELRKKPT